ncbi:hypothetical protein [Streptococcus pluranimalium]|uniref:Uncharacterized protein n=1 Tax=Streptococcus pluranimalium TaxID=82348 RepID=A0A345VN02_9STRE|nr:hypothetical protein [Streptococcus pluranimalium]AXJ14104.1 hypothetical protein Sp14A_22220 [Streptococcus pluranimalium]
MKNNPTRSEKREIERLKAMEPSAGRKGFILNTYFKITIVPLILTGIIYSMSFKVKSIIFLGDTFDIASILFSICLGLTVSFTGALVICEPMCGNDIDYKADVTMVTIIIILLFLTLVSNG